MSNFLLKITYNHEEKGRRFKDCLVYDSFDDLEKDLVNFKLTTNIITYHVYLLTEIDMDTGELLKK